jgi:hypothetical protein
MKDLHNNAPAPERDPRSPLGGLGKSDYCLWISSRLLWGFAALALYILSSGPAMRWSRSPIWPALYKIYRPIDYLDQWRPTSRMLKPYWNLWIDEHSNMRFWG